MSLFCNLKPVTARFVLAGLILLTACSKQATQTSKVARDDSIPVTVAEVEIVPMDRTLTVMGSLAAKSEAVTSAQVEGQVEQTLVDFGTRVEKGQELARIDTASYEALANQSAANLAKAKANALNAQQSLKRVTELQQSKISSASEFDGAMAQDAQARAEVKSAEAALVIAQLNLDRSRVKAPFTGMIAERIATMGDFLKVGAALYRLVDDGELKYIVQAPERYAGEIKLGQTVRFSVDAWPGQNFEGSVYLISPAVSVTTRAFNVGALVTNTDRKLKANTFARGEITLQKGVPTPMVPLDAVINFAGVMKVYVIAEGAARAREVKLGRVHEGRQEVLEGLKTGELVAITGQTKLYEGAKVRLQNTAKNSSGQS